MLDSCRNSGWLHLWLAALTYRQPHTQPQDQQPARFLGSLNKGSVPSFLHMADVASKLRSSSSPPAPNARPGAMRARQQQNRRPTDTRPPTSLMQELRRKNELVNRFQSEALELASSGSASAEKMASICELVTPAF